MNRRTIILLVAAAAVLVVLLLGARIAAVAGAARAGKRLAESGAEHLVRREVTAAATDLGSAAERFGRAQRLLPPPRVDGLIGALPWFGHQYVSMRRLLTAGEAGSRAGREVALGLAGMPLAGLSDERSMAVVSAGLARGRPHLLAAVAAAREAEAASARIREAGLAGPLKDATRSLRRKLAAVSPLLRRAEPGIELATWSLARKRRLLVLAQNGAELRPTGGFIGSYGIVETGPEGLRLVTFQDVYRLPDPKGLVEPPPGAELVTNDFSLRDANWWMDYPTSARRILRFWRQYRQPPVDGVVAIDTVAVRELLSVTGPVRIDAYATTFTAENLLGRLVYLVEVKEGGPGRDKKDVLELLAHEVLDRVFTTPGDRLQALMAAMGRAADSKHVQIYVTDAKVQRAVDAMGWSGRVLHRPGVTDVVAVSSAMTRASKVNMSMRKTIAYEIRLALDGTGDATMTLGFANVAPFRFPLKGVFRDYLRVHRARGTGERGVAAHGAGGPARGTPTAAGAGGGVLPIVAGLPTHIRQFTLWRKQTHTVMIADRVPGAWAATLGAAEAMPTDGAPVVDARAPTEAARGYRLELFRQADLQDIPTTVTVAVPRGHVVSRAEAKRLQDGGALPVAVDGPVVVWSGPLVSDMGLEIRFRRGE